MEIIKKISLLLFFSLSLTAQNDDVLDDVNKYLKNKKIKILKLFLCQLKNKSCFIL